MEFPQLKEVKDTDEICPIHHIKKVSFGGRDPFCPDCQRVKIKQEEQLRVQNAMQKHRRRQTYETLEKDSIIGDPSLKEVSFETYLPDNHETAEALEKAQVFAGEYLQRDRKFNVIFTGLPGSGKSHLAMSMLKFINENANPSMSCLFISVNDLLRRVKDSISNSKSFYTEENMIRLLTSADVLVLDDLGSESSFKRESTESSEYNQKLLFAILNARSRTIITTNLSSRELEEIYNPKIVSRIYRGIDGHIIKFTKATKDKRSQISF